MRSTATARSPSHLSRPESEFSRRSNRAQKCSAGISAITTEFADEPSSERAARRYERGHFGLRKLRRSATPRYGAARAPHRAATAVALAALATAPPALSRRTLRLSRLQRSAARISESSAALQTRLRGRRFQNAAHYQGKAERPAPAGKRAQYIDRAEARPESCRIDGLDI